MTLMRAIEAKPQDQTGSRHAGKTSQAGDREPSSGAQGSLVRIQQALGNRGMARMLGAHLLQANVNLNQMDNEHEQKADRMADGVIQMQASAKKLSESAIPVASNRTDRETALGLSTQTPHQGEAGPLAQKVSLYAPPAIQRKLGFEYEVGYIHTQKNTSWLKSWPGKWVGHQKGEVIQSRNGYDITSDLSEDPGEGNLEFITKPIDETKPSEIATLRRTAQGMVADLRSIFDTSIALRTEEDRRNRQGAFVGADQVPRLNGWWWHRFYTATPNWDTVNGQLQMTGGVQVNKLPGLVSGSVLGQQPSLAAANLQGGGVPWERQALTKYYQTTVGDDRLQPIWRAARTAVDGTFSNHWGAPAKQILASVVALMAQIPIDTRGASSQENSGSLLAKTDYARILELVAIQLGRTIPEDSYLQALIDTINTFLPAQKAVNQNSPVFPSTYRVKDLTFDQQLTLGEWVEGVLPIEDPLAEEEGELEFLPGFDLTTAKNFPGSEEQSKELRAFGTFGSKTDPGNKAILEWRSLQLTAPPDLENVMVSLAGYVARVNT